MRYQTEVDMSDFPHYKEHMTNDMLDCILTFEYLLEEYEKCIEEYKKAYSAAWIKLPAFTEYGKKVLHGAKRETNLFADYWLDRAELTKSLIRMTKKG